MESQTSQTSQTSQNFKISRAEKQKRRRQNLKDTNPEEYRRRQDLENEKRKQRREKLKTENPELHEEHLKSRREKRQADIDENLELHEEHLFERRQQTLEDKIKSWENLFDTYFEKNKVDISKKKWRELKDAEIKFFDEMFDNDISIEFLFEERQSCLNFLRDNLDVCCAGSLLFYIKTFVHHPYDKHKLTDSERNWVKDVVLDEYSPESSRNRSDYRKEYYSRNRDSEIQKQMARSDKHSEIQKNENLNRKFMEADPNKVLSVSDICFQVPLDFNFPYREEFKLTLWKVAESEEEKQILMEKWRKQREDYEQAVGQLSIEYKTEFLKNHGK